MVERVIVATYDGVGGPRTSSTFGDGYEGGPTDAGTYILLYCGKHSSRRYAAWSKIRWGSKLREQGGKVYVRHKGRWRSLSSLTPVTRDQIIEYHKDLYGTAKLPERWVFNDFGHVTCYFFKDRNGNRRFDRSAGERVHGEFFHTTPPDEAATVQGRPVKLTESHGCIHVKPAEIDEMIKKGYMKRGNSIVIHAYNEGLPTLQTDGNATAPYAVHFYPGVKKIVVIGSKNERAPR